MANGKRQMAWSADCGRVWQVANGKRQVANIKWQTANSYEILGAIPQVRIGDNDLLHKRYWDANDFISTDQY